MANNGGLITRGVRMKEDIFSVLKPTTKFGNQTIPMPARDIKLSTLCTSDKINQFSKHKPHRSEVITIPRDSDYSFDCNGTWALNIIRCVNANSLYKEVEKLGLKWKWDYLKPRGSSYNEPYREGDFDGYWHFADNPCGEYLISGVQQKTIGQGGTFSIVLPKGLMPTPESAFNNRNITLYDIVPTGESIALGNMYFGVAVWEGTSNMLNGASSYYGARCNNRAGVWNVTWTNFAGSPYSITYGTYCYYVPFFTPEPFEENLQFSSGRRLYPIPLFYTGITSGETYPKNFKVGTIQEQENRFITADARYLDSDNTQLLIQLEIFNGNEGFDFSRAALHIYGNNNSLLHYINFPDSEMYVGAKETWSRTITLNISGAVRFEFSTRNGTKNYNAYIKTNSYNTEI
ncbi:MAG: hypothetical protein HFJ94_03835 [Muribaculaceae bacterium]|nr:hypothetical protein [Muribaculaceae bacterium]